MDYKKKYIEIRDDIAFLIIDDRIKDGDEIFAKEYFTSKFKVNPSYMNKAIELMYEQKFIEKRDGSYFFTIDEKLKRRLKEEFINKYMNEFLTKLDKLDVGIDEAIQLLNLRKISNG